MVAVTIEYCEVCGFYTKYVKFRRALKKILPKDASIKGIGGRDGSFEVVVDGWLAYSRLGGGGFPKIEDLAAEVKAFADGGDRPESWIKADEAPTAVSASTATDGTAAGGDGAGGSAGAAGAGAEASALLFPVEPDKCADL